MSRYRMVTFALGYRDVIVIQTWQKLSLISYLSNLLILTDQLSARVIGIQMHRMILMRLKFGVPSQMLQVFFGLIFGTLTPVAQQQSTM